MNINHAARILLRSGRNLLTCPCIQESNGHQIKRSGQQLYFTTAIIPVDGSQRKPMRNFSFPTRWKSFSSKTKAASAAGIAATVEGTAVTSVDGVSGDSLAAPEGAAGGDKIASIFTDIENFSQAPVETPFTEMGLGHGYPSGYAQTFMEFLHIDIGLPWWQVIGITTVCLRVIVFPLVIVAQRNMVTLNNHQPTIQKLQIQQQLASVRGELEKSRFAAQALNNYMSVNNCHPVKSLFPIMTQASFFMTMFFAIRGMCGVPVPSLATGGLFWFTDLSLADPTFILPVVTASTIYLQLYLGADGLNTSTMPPIMKKIIYVIPALSVPVMIQFPAALNLYWLSNNIISVCQASLIRQPGMKEKLGIGEMIKWKPEDLPATNFHEELKREFAAQKSKQSKLEATKQREKKEAMEEEKKRREKLLKALHEEETQRAQSDAKKSMK